MYTVLEDFGVLVARFQRRRFRSIRNLTRTRSKYWIRINGERYLNALSTRLSKHYPSRVECVDNALDEFLN